MASDLNKVIIIGRLTRDAELKYLSSGMAVTKFSIAVNRKKKQGDAWIDEAHFFDVVAWGKLGENLNKYLVKGKQLAIEGELQQDRWEQDGQSRSKVSINASAIQLLGGGEGERHQPAPSAKENWRPDPRANSDVPPDDFPDDIPFN